MYYLYTKEGKLFLNKVKNSKKQFVAPARWHTAPKKMGPGRP